MKRKNKSTLLVCINCMIITLAILLLPLAFFETSIYVKRSANTFVGDEKYVEARAEVEAVAAQHEGAVLRRPHLRADGIRQRDRAPHRC